jgi:uncharacterized membrane protein YfcA
VAIGLLGLLMAPAEAAAIPVVPSLVTNIWQALGMALASMWLGKLLRRQVREATFRLWFFLGLLALGVHLALRGVL